MIVRVKAMANPIAEEETIKDVVYIQFYGNYVKAMYEAAIFTVKEGEVAKVVVPATDILGVDNLEGNVSEETAEMFRRLMV